jgi:hypothetical protein
LSQPPATASNTRVTGITIHCFFMASSKLFAQPPA